MNSIQKVFITQTIPDFLDKEFDMSYIKFAFDEKTLVGLSKDLEKEFKKANENKDIKELKKYKKGLKAMLYLWKNRLEYLAGSDDVFIHVHDSKEFFSSLQELIDLYNKRYRSLLDSNNFIRSIWLRMSVEDIENVELFLRKQKCFMENESVLDNYKEYARINDEDILAYRINDNDDWFETNQNIVFSIRRTDKDLKKLSFREKIEKAMELSDYDFPAIHFGFASTNNQLTTCYLYGIQNMHNNHNNKDIKDSIQPIRKELRNKCVSADILIALSLFFDFLYKIGVKDVEIPTLQVLNYPYHEQMSKSTKEKYNKYTDAEKCDLEERSNNGDTSDEVEEYMYIKYLLKSFADKQDTISYNKSERLINAIIELCDRYPVLNITSYPFMEGENMHIKINGEINILNSKPKKRSY